MLDTGKNWCLISRNDKSFLDWFFFLQINSLWICINSLWANPFFHCSYNSSLGYFCISFAHLDFSQTVLQALTVQFCHILQQIWFMTDFQTIWPSEPPASHISPQHDAATILFQRVEFRMMCGVSFLPCMARFILCRQKHENVGLIQPEVLLPRACCLFNMTFGKLQIWVLMSSSLAVLLQEQD